MASTSPDLDHLVERIREAQLPPPSERRRIRRRASIPLHLMAEPLKVTPRTLQRWENGEVQPTLEHAIRYRALLDALRKATDAA